MVRFAKDAVLCRVICEADHWLGFTLRSGYSLRLDENSSWESAAQFSAAAAEGATRSESLRQKDREESLTLERLARGASTEGAQALR